MTDEGELKKRLFGLKDSYCFCGGEIPDEADPEYRPPKSCKTKRKLTEDEQKTIIDEAKKEYWSLVQVDRDHKGTPMRIKLLDPITAHNFFIKWFGGFDEEASMDK